MLDLPRLEDWPRLMEGAIAPHVAAPFVYGSSDCFIMPADVVAAIIGRDLWPEERGAYDSEAGAARRLAARGFRSIADAFAEHFAEHEHYSRARRGDVGVIERDGLTSGVIVVGRFCIGKHPSEGVLRVPVELMTRSFMVGT